MSSKIITDGQETNILDFFKAISRHINKNDGITKQEYIKYAKKYHLL